MSVLVLSRRHSPDSNAMWRAAADAGWDVVRVQGYEAPEELRGRRDVAYYGETLLADAIAPELGLALMEPDARWLAELPDAYLRRAVRPARLAEVRSRTERAFVKPVDEKVLAARVYERDEAIDPERALADDLAVLVSEPVRFEVEVRAFLIEREVAALSAYVRDGEIARTEDGEWPLSREERGAARELLDAMLADAAVALPPGVVIDVGRIAGRGWAVVEANAAWASGLCGCDARDVLRVVGRACVPRDAVASDQARWVRGEHGSR